MKVANLDTATMIVEFNASVWTARKLDRSVTDEVVRDKNAGSKSAGRFNKNLLAGRPELEAISKHVGMARTYVYDNTIPWSDAGQRLVANTRLLKFDDRMQQYKVEFDTLVAEFVHIYPTLITAQAMALGDMFNRNDFPAASVIAHKFAFNVDYLPVPSAGDIRVDIGREAQAELQERLKKMADARVERAVADIRDRLGEHLKRMADRLVSDTDAKTGEPKQRRFHDTLVTNAFELCDLVRDMNITRDPLLDNARAVLEKALAGKSADDLRDDYALRNDVQQQVTKLLDKWNF